jgi:hypothetical protein
MDADARMLAALMQQLVILHGDDEEEDDGVVAGPEQSMAAGSAIAFLTGGRGLGHMEKLGSRNASVYLV